MVDPGVIAPRFRLSIYTLHDLVPVFWQRLADFMKPTILWTGGISEIKKTVAVAEA